MILLIRKRRLAALGAIRFAIAPYVSSRWPLSHAWRVRGPHITLLLISSVVLSGCFGSREPLITAANADYPFVKANFELSERQRQGGSRLRSFTVFRQGDHYKVQYHYETGIMKETEPPKWKFLFRKIRDNVLVLQNESFFPGEEGSFAGPGLHRAHSYLIIKKDGESLTLINCHDFIGADIRHIDMGWTRDDQRFLGREGCPVNRLDVFAELSGIEPRARSPDKLKIHTIE